MAVMPGANFLNAATSSLMSRYDIVCIHTIVGYAPAHAAHFSTRADGWIYQSRDTKYRSAANLNGNYRVIAIENEDHGPAYGAWSGSNVPGFTAAQKEAIAKILVWCYQTHGIPLVLAPDSKPGSRGIAYHRQGIDGNFGGYAYGGRVAGGEIWSSSTGKVCPGDTRIRQLINEIIPRARQLAGLDGDDDMNEAQNNALTDAGWRTYAIMAGWTVIPQQQGIPERLWGEQVTVNQELAKIRRMLWEGGDVPGSTAAGTVVDDLNTIRPQVSELSAKLELLEGKLNQIVELLTPETQA